MRLPARVAVVAALAPLGTIAGHVAGYRLAGHEATLDVSHTHLRPVAWLALALGTAAIAVFILRPRSSGSPRAVWLVAVQVGLFFCLEAAEHLLAGHGLLDVTSDPSFGWGLVAQIASAGLLVLGARVARTSGERLRALLLRRAETPPPVGQSWHPSAVAGRSVVLASPASERGPPLALFVA